MYLKVLLEEFQKLNETKMRANTWQVEMLYILKIIRCAEREINQSG